MEKLDLALVGLAIIFVFMLGFAINDLYFNNKINVNNTNQPINAPEVKTTPNKSISLGSDINSCINNTKDNPQCKDCCDCLTSVDSTTRTSCRNTCAVHDFSTNKDIVTITIPSTLGKNGDYSVCVAKGASECKTCCENQIGLVCGDYQYCRTACNDAFGDAKHNISANTP